MRLSWGSYKAHKKDLIQASYDEKILGKMFPGRVFPSISFTYYQIRFLTWEQMCSLCKAFGITTSRSNKARRSQLREFFKEHC